MGGCILAMDPPHGTVAPVAKESACLWESDSGTAVNSKGLPSNQ